jgi:phage shock protein B
MEDVVVPVMIMAILFIGLPWIIFHYVTKWKSAASLTAEDENLLDDLHDTARRLEDRLCSIERIMTAENPNWRLTSCDPASIGIEDGTRSLGLQDGIRSNQPTRRISQ